MFWFAWMFVTLWLRDLVMMSCLWCWYWWLMGKLCLLVARLFYSCRNIALFILYLFGGITLHWWFRLRV